MPGPIFHKRLHKQSHEFGEDDELAPADIGQYGVAEKTAGGLIENHVTQHELGGDDEIDVGGLAGELADPQPPKSHNNTAHSETYITASGVTKDNLDSNGDVGTGSDQVAQGDHTHEGTEILSTGETGGTKFLREDGDGTSSWQDVPGIPSLVSSGTASVPDNTKTTLATFTITDGKVPMPFISLEEETASTQIYPNSTDSAPSTDEIYFCLEKTGTADQYLLTVRTNNVGGSAANRNIRWAVMEV